MPNIEHGQSYTNGGDTDGSDKEGGDTEGLARNLLAAAVLSGIVIGVSGTGAAAAEPAATRTESADSIRAQFDEAFTPGEEWIAGGPGDIGLIH
ncbi:hypothetical protein [Phytohabitans aurantiacus]|uniref:Uncharacterized protein n=1 Tax=Phytohabitans aurantiacus TaxID=3016789 RepID=A0ABQ5R5J2_9ACTN|nr:hypothetical protein [Phytohabitans aurantiacus]GLI01811.1 hypothetical protein Pa4123_70880 [Phytohabitans aurantiacus]